MMALVGILLSTGALGKGLDPDDLAHRGVIQRGITEGSPRPLWELYVHIPHSPRCVVMGRNSGAPPGGPGPGCTSPFCARWPPSPSAWTTSYHFGM